MKHLYYKEIQGQKKVVAHKLLGIIQAVAVMWSGRECPGIGKLSKTSHRRLLERVEEQTELLGDLCYILPGMCFPKKKYRRQVLNIQKLRYGKLYFWYVERHGKSFREEKYSVDGLELITPQCFGIDRDPLLSYPLNYPGEKVPLEKVRTWYAEQKEQREQRRKIHDDI